MNEQFDGRAIYVADAAAITKDNLAGLHDAKIHFISRLPATYSLCEKLKQAAWEKQKSWRDIGRLADSEGSATYKIQSFRRELYDHTYRFIVVRSTSLDARKERKLQDVLSREAKALEKAAGEQGKCLYSYEADAVLAAQAFVRGKRRAMHSLETSVEVVQTTAKRATRGRPEKDDPTPVQTTQYRIRVKVGEPGEEALQAWREREATFVLITDIRDDQRLSDEGVLRLYKEQHEVEGRFRFLKSPYHVGPIYLQRPSRVKAFGYLMLLSLLLYSAFEYVIRQQMAKEKEPLILPGKRESFRPTGASVLEMFERLSTTWVSLDEQWQRARVKSNNPAVERVLGFFGLDMSIYCEAQKSA